MSDRGWVVTRNIVIDKGTSILRLRKKDAARLGRQWFRGFRRRHPELVKRRTDALERHRATGANAAAITHFFQVYEKLIADHDLSPAQISR